MVDGLEKTRFGKNNPVFVEPKNLAKLEVLYESSKKTRLMDMLEQIIAMTQHMLGAEAA